MSVRRLYQLGALACILSAAFLIASDVFFPAGILASMVNLLAAVFHLLALNALYLRQRKESGVLGGVAYIIHMIGLALLIGGVFSETFVFPLLGGDIASRLLDGPQSVPFGTGIVLFTLGVVLFSIATFRARVFPRWSAVLYGLGYAATILVPVITPLVLGVAAAVAAAGLLWMGFTLWATLDE